jgi:hypothetical protein
MLSSAFKVRSKGSESLITAVSSHPSLFGGSSIGGCSIGGSSFGGCCFGGSSVGGSVGDSLIKTLHCYDNHLAFFRAAHLAFIAALIRALPSALITPRFRLRVPVLVLVLPARSLRACCSREIGLPDLLYQ